MSWNFRIKLSNLSTLTSSKFFPDIELVPNLRSPLTFTCAPYEMTAVGSVSAFGSLELQALALDVEMSAIFTCADPPTPST